MEQQPNFEITAIRSRISAIWDQISEKNRRIEEQQEAYDQLIRQKNNLIRTLEERQQQLDSWEEQFADMKFMRSLTDSLRSEFSSRNAKLIGDLEHRVSRAKQEVLDNIDSKEALEREAGSLAAKLEQALEALTGV